MVRNLRVLCAAGLLALAAAIADARPRAEEAAKAAGMRITGVRSVAEQGASVPQGYGGGGGAGLSDGIATGDYDVVVRAQVIFDVAR